MPLLPWCSHWHCTPSDIEPPAPDPKYKPSEAGNTHPLENIHVHSITSIFISSDVEKKPLLVSFLKSSFTKNVCISDLSSKSFYQLNKKFQLWKVFAAFFFFFPYEFIWHSIDIHGHLHMSVFVFYNTLLKCWLRNSLVLSSLEPYFASSSPSPFNPGRRGLFLSQPLTNKQTKH